MKDIDYWRLCDEYNVYQAVLLITGLNPSDYLNIKELKIQDCPENYPAVLKALLEAIKSDKIEAEVKTKEFTDIVNTSGENQSLVKREVIDLEGTMMSFRAIQSWLKTRGINEGFFFPNPPEEPMYLEPSHKTYSPKLAAAIMAWQAVNENPDLRSGKTVKKALQKWLIENAERFKLIKDDGTPNKLGIEEIAKIANWDPKGGAPKTPC